MRTWNVSWAVGLLLSPLLLCQCATQGDTGDDDGLYDASQPANDSGASDATAKDTGSTSFPDTGTAVDTGSSAADTGHANDTGSEADSGTTDSGTGADSGASGDSGVADTGVADTQVADSHVADTNAPDTNVAPDGGNDLACVNNLSMCVACCQNNHVEGTNTYIDAIVACECGSGGACKTQCGGATNYCATMMTPSNNCNTCLNTTLGDNGTCVNPVNDACNADPDCVAYLACTNQNANCD